ncbi:MAG: ABC transporter substrate-binding protein [Planctomycetaceae bacterium]
MKFNITNRLTVMLMFILMGMMSQPWDHAPYASAQPPAEATPDAENKEETEASAENDEPATEAEPLPTLEQMEIPSAEDLLRKPPVDWIVLERDEEVIVAEPVSPRPDTLRKLQEALEQKIKDRRNVPSNQVEAYRRELERMSKLALQLPDQVDEPDYLLDLDKISQVIHHEDLMLRRIDLLTKEQNFDLAYELLNLLRRNTPDWPGALDRHNGLLLAEADRKIADGNFEEALARTEEIYSRTPEYAGLPEKVGNIIDNLIQQALAAEDWRRARHYHRRIETMYPSHPLVETLTTRFSQLAEQELNEADTARSQGKHALALDHAEKAAAIWPLTRNLRTRYRTFSDRYQRLHVGVLDLPPDHERESVVRSPAERRGDRLTTIRFFEVDSAQDGSAHYSTRFCDRWEPLNLGREAVFELRDNRQPWEAQPIVTAPVIAERIASRLDPSSDAYDERFAGYASSVDVTSPFSFTLNFSRVPIRTEALLYIPLIESDSSVTVAGEQATTSPVSLDSSPSLAGGFHLAEKSPSTVVYRRTLSEPEGQRLYHLSEVQEHLYPDVDAAMQGLMRGEVSMLVNPPAWHVNLLRQDDELLKAFFVEKSAVPITHVLQFNPHSTSLKNREFRRALAYAINREKILSDTVLQSDSREYGRIVDGPFPSQSYANSALVLPREYDPLSAISLTLAARRQLGGELPSLRMAVVSEPVVRAAASELVESWSRFGITVEIIDVPQGPLVGAQDEAPSWDLIYRTVSLTEPVTQLWPFLTLTGRAQVSDLDPFPDWLRQEIIDLDLATDWNAALQLVSRLHLHLWGEVMLIPLWEVDDYLIYRKNVRGVPVDPVHPYEEIDRWVVESWFAEDLP